MFTKNVSFCSFTAGLFISVLVGEFIVCTLSTLFTVAIGIMESASRYYLEDIKKQNLKIMFSGKTFSENNASKKEKYLKIMQNMDFF